ncbi:glyoxalase [Fibrisoma montanum]|uniref:Glyoxalase n=1 Tax=Fibrisoma montanum TaxID=2305895 RepID=A0A418MHG2_9BACT|nr:VOC family protein [Fibrisoma montanum]RIV26859.1 glyoxalase [Fibrisoma montanum]
MRIEHIALWVRDLDAMRTFYETYFGAQSGAQYVNPSRQFTSYFLSFADGCRLELMAMPGIDDRTSGPMTQYLGLTHLAVSVGSQSAVDELTDQLRADGYVVAGQPRWTGDGYYESVVLDPENNRIEITI